ncbi:hypothetical protein RCH11_003190 [Glaciihabitans sp. GrIS 2.15]|nr:hypothetical protein [Glaciihabitans sp. GrIS 2.15]
MAKRQVKWQRTISLHPYSSMRSNDPRTLRGHEKIHANLTEHLGQPIDAWMARTPPPRPWTIGEWTITLHLFLAHGSSVMLRVERTSIADRAERDAAAPAGFTRNVRIAFRLRAPELDGHSVNFLAGAPRRRTSTIGAEKAGVRPINISVAFAEISDLDKMNGTDPPSVCFPATPRCPENAVISADNSPVNRTD